MNKQQLASKIWESANKMRSKIEANEYKDYILGFIFYKFLSDKLVESLMSEGLTLEELRELSEDDKEVVNHCQTSYGYFISYNNLFSTWLDKGNDFNVSDVRDALSAFDRLISKSYEKVYKGIFDTLQTGLSKLGDSANAQTKAVRDLIHLIKDIPMDGRQDYDVLGFIYEFLISKFAANAGKKAGEFYTPYEVSQLMSEIVSYELRDNKYIEIYDPTSGSGSLLINIGKSVGKHLNNPDNIKYYAQELKQNTYNLTRMNLVMRGIKPDNIVTRNADTLEQDWPYIDENDNYSTLYVDAVVSNPPYSQSWDTENKENDPRYADYGVAPRSKADYAFLLHDLFHVKRTGLMAIVLPHGVLFRGGTEGEIRKNLIENNKIDTVIGLPANIFFGTGIPTIIMILKQKRDKEDILFIDASKEFVKVGKNNQLLASHIRKIVDVYKNRETIDKFSKVVTRGEIRDNDYNLNIPRYVDSSKEKENWDIFSITKGGIPNIELETLNKFWEIFPNLKDKLIIPINSSYSKLTTKDIKKVINEDEGVINLKNKFHKSFYDFDKYLQNILIENIMDVNIDNTREIVANNVLNRVTEINFLDKYSSYQIFDNKWMDISNDIEVIQTSGIDIVKKVSPNYITRKRQGKDVEVQDGYVGEILPFDLIQNKYMKEELNEKENMKLDINNLESEMDEFFENLSEEDKDHDIFNEDKTAFINADLLRFVKTLDSEEEYEEDSFEEITIKTSENLLNVRKLKRDLRTKESKIHLSTKELIENLDIEEAIELLKDKWIHPITTSILNLFDKEINKLINKLNSLSNKTTETLADIENQINETSQELKNMLDDLTGDEYTLKALEELKKILGGE